MICGASIIFFPPLFHHSMSSTAASDSSTRVSQLPVNFRQFWYPISLSKDLLAGEIVGLHLLGDPVCLYREKGGRVVCLADRCAHRSAPLSIGQIRDEQLECKYHGWKYDAEGKVSHIPALLPDRSIPANAVVYAYPVHELDGLIWVWPGSKALANPGEIPQVSPGAIAGSRRATEWSEPFTMAVDLDIDHSLMVENLLDPAHIPFTHEGTLGKRSRARPLKMSDITVVDVGEWFSSAARKPDSDKPWKALRGTVKGNDTATTHFHFIPPCFVMLHHQFGSGKHFQQSMLCVPRKPGHMRLIYMHSRDFFTWLEKIPGVYGYTYRLSAKIQFQDYELLHGQQARLQQGSKAWHTPIQVDGLPKAYREWLRLAHQADYSWLKQDDYRQECSSSGGGGQLSGPYFAGWRRCTASSGKQQGDIEDLHPCHQDCSVPPTLVSADQLDDEWSIPQQRGVDNSAYTWRRDRQLGRGLSKQRLGDGTGILWWLQLTLAAVGGGLLASFIATHQRNN